MGRRSRGGCWPRLPVVAFGSLLRVGVLKAPPV
jgi:hypothetical protein